MPLIGDVFLDSNGILPVICAVLSHITQRAMLLCGIISCPFATQFSRHGRGSGLSFTGHLRANGGDQTSQLDQISESKGRAASRYKNHRVWSYCVSPTCRNAAQMAQLVPISHSHLCPCQPQRYQRERQAALRVESMGNDNVIRRTTPRRCRCARSSCRGS